MKMIAIIISLLSITLSVTSIIINIKARRRAKKPKTDKQIRKWLKNPHSDSAEYKMWGNGMALPNVLYVMEGVKKYFEEVKGEETK